MFHIERKTNKWKDMEGFITNVDSTVDLNRRPHLSQKFPYAAVDEKTPQTSRKRPVFALSTSSTITNKIKRRIR